MENESRIGDIFKKFTELKDDNLIFKPHDKNSSVKLDSLQCEIPAEINSFLETCDNFTLYNFKIFTSKEIFDWTDELRVNAQWRNEYLILGIDMSEEDKEEVDREFLILNTNDIIWTIDEGVVQKISESFINYLDKFYEELKAGDLDFDEETKTFS